MRQTVKLRTNEGDRVRIVLENWGLGLDHLRRRWVRADSYGVHGTLEGGAQRNLARVEPRFLVIEPCARGRPGSRSSEMAIALTVTDLERRWQTMTF